MRRLAKQKREDAYSSQRDYQAIESVVSQRIERVDRPQHRLILAARFVDEANTPFVAFGGFVQPSESCTLLVVLSSDGQDVERKYRLAQAWNRVGAVVEAPSASDALVQLRWPGAVALNVWGLASGRVNTPDVVAASNPTVSDLQQDHLCPETFYLNHDGPLLIDINEEASTKIELSSGARMSLKKCSYCGRLLPVDPGRPGLLSFHKHRAKKTGHQNECRVCKKWRINDDFNPKRTTDQLHESSVITRERKLLLREPAILQRIKDRTGAGLKSQIWERFGRRCFRCRQELELDEVQLDHTRPLAYLWPIDDHATCLCAGCNNLKKEKFPIDVYSGGQLEELASISGLSKEQLAAKTVNEEELLRVVDSIDVFADEWDARTFAAIARKVEELRPDIDLFAELQSRNPSVHARLLERLKDRPLSVGADDE